MSSLFAQRRRAPQPFGCLRRYSGGAGSAYRVVCFPWAGAGASVYRRFAARWAPSVECLAVQYPGREDRFGDALPTSLSQLAREALTSLAPILDRPMLFLGHSMGALVAYETAQLLKRACGFELDLLVVSGSGSPETEALPPRSAQRSPAMTRPPERSADEAFIADLARIGGTPPELLNDASAMRALLPILRADYAVLDGYCARLGEPLSCGLLICAGDSDATVAPSALSDWARFTTGPSELCWFAGDHFYLRTDPEALVRSIQRRWARTQDRERNASPMSQP